MIRRTLLAATGVVAAALSARAGDVEVHYAPAENLEHVDVGLIRSAKLSIDLAAFALTDWPVIDELNQAAARGIAVRIVLDPSQPHAFDRLAALSDSIRIKRPGPYMHLKAYAIDGVALRSGSANLTASGLKRQDNDIIVARDEATAKAFETRFEAVWDAAVPLVDDPKAVAAIEPR